MATTLEVLQNFGPQYLRSHAVSTAQARAWRPGPACAHRPCDEQAMDWAHAGARLIGGCCRTTPADIAALVARWSH